jgi:CBS domain containing-hemolysin-like protein
MVPRPEVRTVSTGTSTREAARLIRATGLTRVPLVHDGDLDRAHGLIHAKDLLAVLDGDERPLTDLARGSSACPRACSSTSCSSTRASSASTWPSSSTSTGRRWAW